MPQEQDSKNNAWTDIVPRLRSKWQKASPSSIFHRYLLNPKPLAQFPLPQKEGILETTEFTVSELLLSNIVSVSKNSITPCCSFTSGFLCWTYILHTASTTWNFNKKGKRSTKIWLHILFCNHIIVVLKTKFSHHQYARQKQTPSSK
jgi:hypothetical protein